MFLDNFLFCSKFVHQFYSTVHFKNEAEVELYKVRLQTLPQGYINYYTVRNIIFTHPIRSSTFLLFNLKAFFVLALGSEFTFFKTGRIHKKNADPDQIKLIRRNYQDLSIIFSLNYAYNNASNGISRNIYAKEVFVQWGMPIFFFLRR